MKYPLPIIAVLLLSCITDASANPPTQQHIPSPWRIGVAVGYGERSNPLIQSEDIPIVVDLDIAWFGKRAFFDNGDVGYTLHDGDAFTLSFVGRINSDRLFFSRTNTRLVTFSQVVTGSNGLPQTIITTERIAVPDRDYAIEAGLELLSGGEWGELQLSLYHDVSGTHDGFELYGNYARGFQVGRWRFEPSFGASYKSERRNDYFWGVRADESGPLLPQYEAGSGIGFSARFLAGYQLTRHWTAVAVFQTERLSTTVTDSPLVRDESVVGHFVGLQYRF